MKLLHTSMAAAAALIAGAASAQAGCGDYSVLMNNKQHFVKMPLPPRNVRRADDSSIVGMWLVNYWSGGHRVYQGLEQWHSDGLEWESADLPTLGGNVCMGAWSVNGSTVNLYHTGWIFNNGVPSGTMQLTHADTVSKDGDNFHGQFDLKFFDADGNLLQEISGNDYGKRISAP